jgi:hypothetical protein
MVNPVIGSFTITLAIRKPEIGHRKSQKDAFTALSCNRYNHNCTARIDTGIASHITEAKKDRLKSFLADDHVSSVMGSKNKLPRRVCQPLIVRMCRLFQFFSEK